MLNEDTIVLEIEVTRETAGELKALVAAFLWEPNEGLRMILGAGIGALITERSKEVQTDSEKIRQISRLLVESEGRLASTRFNLSEAKQALKRWELSNGAIRELIVSIEQVIRRQNQEIDELKSRLKQRDEEIKRLRAQLGEELVDEPTQPATQEPLRPVKKGWRLGSKGKG